MPPQSRLLHREGLDGHWRRDDTQVLRQIFQHGAIASFHDASAYNQFSITNLFPWLLLSMELDMRLFELRPAWFYLHQHLAVAAASICLFLVGRQWMRAEFAFLGAIAFLSGPPVVVISEQLMTRHYIEGLVFALLALYLYTRHFGRPATWRLAASAFFYALAVTCKETYVPLVLLLPFVPRGSVEARLRAALPFALVAALYVFWRSHMLQSLFGGHAGILQIDPQSARTAAGAFLNIPSLLFQSFYWPAVFLCLAIILAGIVSGRTRGPLLPVVTALMLAPLVPLAEVPGIAEPDRYLLLPWAGLSFGLAWFTARFFDSANAGGRVPKAAGAAALIAVIGISLFNSRQYLNQAVVPVAQQFDAHAKFLLSHGDNAAYVPGPTILGNFWFVSGIREILPHIGKPDGLPAAIVDPLWLGTGGTPVFRYDPDCACMARAGDDWLARYADQNASAREEPLRIELRFGQGFLRWELGPHRDGEYRLVSQNLGSLLLPPSGSIPTTIQTLRLLEAPFVLKYSSPQGWITYSPELSLGIAESADSAALEWERP